MRFAGGGLVADRVKPWTVELLLPAGERLPEGVEVGFCTERSNVSVYAALHAAGCPRLAFLLTDFHPVDPLEERIAALKEWLCTQSKNERGACAASRCSPRGSSCPGAC